MKADIRDNRIVHVWRLDGKAPNVFVEHQQLYERLSVQAQLIGPEGVLLPPDSIAIVKAAGPSPHTQKVAYRFQGGNKSGNESGSPPFSASPTSSFTSLLLRSPRDQCVYCVRCRPCASSAYRFSAISR